MPETEEIETPDVHRVRLEFDVNRTAWAKARAAGVRKDRWLAGLIERYAAGPIPDPTPAPEDDRDFVRIRLFVDDGTWERAQTRAKAEGRGISDALSELVVAEESAA